MQIIFIRALAVAFTVFIIWVIVLADTGKVASVFGSFHSLRYSDKIGHFLLFGFLSLIINAALRFRSFTCLKLRLYTGTVAVSIFVVLEELSQHYFPNRTLDIYDLAADAAGICVFSVIAYLINKILKHRSA
ncbi:MAG: VanZ family protein [Flavobacteriales bacterium]|jgi:VanZ family protein